MNKLSKYIVKIYVLLFLIGMYNNGYAAQDVLKVVVLGSSTSEGTGSTGGLGWVSRYTAYLKNISINNEVINLGKGGYSTYNIMPNGNSVPNRPSPDTDRNITKALLYNPDVIIVNMPSNDIANGYLTSEVLANYATLKTLADAAGAEIYFATTQPRNFEVEKRQQQVIIKDQTIATYPDRYLDFWTGIAESDGTIKTEYNHDGIHVNNAGHEVLFNTVVAKASILSHAKPISFTDYSAMGRILIDFGGTTTLSSDNWNNVTGPRQVGISYAVSLKNSDYEMTPYKIFVHDAFNEVNFEGVVAGVNILDYPNSASNDSFFGNGSGVFNSVSEPTGGVTLDNLDANKLYTLKFFAGRRGVSDNRQAKYTVKGKTTQIVYLDGANNIATVSVINMEPDANKKIIIDVTYGDLNTNNSKFYYLGILDIEYKPKTTPVELLGFSLSKNTQSIDLNWTTLSESHNSHFEVYRLNIDNEFKRLSSVPASLNTGVNTYYYNDKDPLSGINYYFLRQIDVDGTYKDYEVKSINFGHKTNGLNVYIPSGTNKLMISGVADDAKEILEISVMKTDGRLLTRKEAVLDVGDSEIEISRLNSKGIYVVMVKKSNKLFSYKVLY